MKIDVDGDKGGGGKKDSALSLQNYWKTKINEAILAEVGREEENESKGNVKGKKSSAAPVVTIVNCASEEYGCMIDVDFLNAASSSSTSTSAPVIYREIKVLFQTPDGRSVPSTTIKQARGLIVRYCCLNGVESLEDLETFSDEGYEFHSTKEGEGKKEGCIIFVKKSGGGGSGGSGKGAKQTTKDEVEATKRKGKEKEDEAEKVETEEGGGESAAKKAKTKGTNSRKKE